MEYYKVFMKALKKEINKFKLDSKVLYSTYVTHLTASLAESFDVPYYRCAYLYRYATGSIYFFNDCIKVFLLEYSNIKDILSLWKSYSEVKVCSLSAGPGLDYLGFLLAILEYDSSPPNFNGVTIVSKYGAWKNTVKFICEVFHEQGTAFKVACPNLKYENVDVIQADLLKGYSGIDKILVNEAVNEANVILMMKTLNLLDFETPQEKPLLHMLKELICSLKTEAIIFCIDTKPSVALLTQALSYFPGKFLHGPVHETAKIPVDFPVIGGCRPVISLRGAFFVWQKLSMSTHLNLCTPPLANISVSTENKCNLTPSSCDNKSNSSAVGNEAKIEDKYSDSSVNLPWIELKSFWKCSSPKTKELLKQFMLTDEEGLDQLKDLNSQSDINKKNPTTAMFQDIKLCDIQKIPINVTQTAMLEDINLIPVPSQNQMQDLSVDTLKSTVCSNLQNTLNEGNSSKSVGSLSSPGTLNSVSSFTSENDFSSARIEGKGTGTTRKSSETLHSYHALDKNISGGDTITKVYSEKNPPCENKLIQTGTLQDISASSSAVKALTERIRQLEISLESMSQLNELCNYDCGDSNEPCTKRLHNFTPPNNAGTADKPSCSKQLPSYCFEDRDSLPSYESEAEKNVSIQNMHHCTIAQNMETNHYSCHTHCCSRSCSIQPCCAPHPIRRCNFSCNSRQQSRENNFENFTSPTIAIPVQHISENTLFQIISLIKSEFKNK